MPPPDSETPALSKISVDRLITRRQVHLQAATLWRMLYETVARAEEILGVDIEQLDLAARRAPVKAKNSKPRTRRRRGAPREEYVVEPVYRDAGTTRLPPRLIKGRTRGAELARLAETDRDLAELLVTRARSEGLDLLGGAVPFSGSDRFGTGSNSRCGS